MLSAIRFGRQKPSVVSLYDKIHNADNPTTRTTTITEAETIKPEQGPGLQLPSKNAIDLSPNAKAALNAFQYTLNALGKMPIPGIGAFTTALLQVVKGVQVGACLLGSFVLAWRFSLHLGNTSSRGWLERASRTYDPSLVLSAQNNCRPGITRRDGTILDPT